MEDEDILLKSNIEQLMEEDRKKRIIEESSSELASLKTEQNFLWRKAHIKCD